jgi:predicted DNA-binding transcriptional regulator AlpA
VTIDQLIDEEELAKKTGISRATLKTMRVRPELKGPPFIRIGRTIRYSIEAVERWLESRVVDPTRPRRAR